MPGVPPLAPVPRKMRRNRVAYPCEGEMPGSTKNVDLNATRINRVGRSAEAGNVRSEGNPDVKQRTNERRDRTAGFPKLF